MTNLRTGSGSVVSTTTPANLPVGAEEDAQLFHAHDVKILVIDDDPAIGRLVQSAFSGRGFIVESVSDPTRVEQQQKQTQYELIILDYVLPGLDAKTVLDWLHLHQPDTCIIVVTAFPSIDSALQCLRSRTY